MPSRLEFVNNNGTKQQFAMRFRKNRTLLKHKYKTTYIIEYEFNQETVKLVLQ